MEVKAGPRIKSIYTTTTVETSRQYQPTDRRKIDVRRTEVDHCSTDGHAEMLASVERLSARIAPFLVLEVEPVHTKSNQLRPWRTSYRIRLRGDIEEEKEDGV